MIAKTYWAVLLVQHRSVVCCSIHEDQDDAKRDCRELQNQFTELRYNVAEIGIEDEMWENRNNG
jgi:hypothetical protein